jgi:hypothetical protein
MIHEDAGELALAEVVVRIFDCFSEFAHRVPYRDCGAIVHLALKQAQHLWAVLGRLDKAGEEG